MVTCGRYEIVCKNSVGDLQAGEKYGNMDYVVASALRHLAQLLFFCSHTTSCVSGARTCKNLKERLLNLLPHVCFQITHYFVNTGRHGGDRAHLVVEQADGGEYAGDGAGSCQDTLDDFWHYWNWNKVVGMGFTLRKQLVKARKELTHQRGEVSAWKKAIDDFETGASTANPYELPHASPTLHDIKLELVCEEQDRERNSTTMHEATDDTMIEYLMLGVEIEGQQRQLSADLLAKKNPTTKELTDFVTHRTQISRQIKKLWIMQRKYSPGALQCLATAGDLVEPPEVECISLFLPSGLSLLQATPPLSVPDIAIAEARLHDAQCSESLEVLRHGLIIKRRAADVQDTELPPWRALEKADLQLPEDEEAKRRKQCAMKGKRKEAQQVNKNGEGRRHASRHGFGTPPGDGGHGWGGDARGCEGGVPKVYVCVKRWWEEECFLQEEMVHCLLMLKWQAVQ
ncbi:hypothetical protein B0H14DRAFT_2651465 [Mycena olivaceomarginata]|nr:hypothetical protein B0H14DRAFT_2651465 [Mycena olivaceomarginata]